MLYPKPRLNKLRQLGTCIVTMAKRKRPDEKVRAVASHTGSARSAQKLIKNFSTGLDNRTGENTWSNAAARELKSVAAEYQTTLELKQRNGGDSLPFHVVKLASVLTWFCSINEGFASFLLKGIRGNVSVGIYLYCDGVTPGAVLAPMNSRKSFLWYLGFESFRYHLHEEVNWICVAIMKNTVVDKVSGGLSAASRALIHHLFDSQVEVVQIQEQTWLLKLKLSNLLGDADAMRAIFCAMGAGGVRPCLKCTNCMYKRQAHTMLPAGFATIAESNFALFKPMKNELLWKIVDYLKSVAETRPKSVRDAEETLHGLHWEPNGLLADVTLRGTVLPSHGTGDAMHIFFSKGTAALEVGLFMEAGKGENIQLARLQAFAETWNCGSEVRSALHHTKFKSSTYKGSASECKSIMPLMGEFANVIVTQPSLALHVKSMVALADVCRELQVLKFTRLEAELDVTKLASLLSIHLDAFVAAYGEEHVKPKHHQALHLPDEYKEAKRAMDCFTCERHNKAWKLDVAPYCTPHGLEKHSLSKLLLIQAMNLKTAQYKEQYMHSPAPSDRVALSYGWDDALLSSSCWRKGQTFKVGHFMSEGGAEALEVTSCVSDGGEIYLVCQKYQLAACKV